MRNTKSKAKGISFPKSAEIALGKLNFAPYNPRTITREKMAALKASLLKHGMVLNLVVQRRSEEHGPNIIIGGHQRTAAMREICAERGWPEPEGVPCTVLDVGDAEAKQLNVALNSIEGEFDPYKLGEVFASIRGDMTVDDIAATGFLHDEVDELIRLVRPPEEQAAALEAEAGGDGLGGFAASITLSVEFDTAENRDAAKAILKQAVEGTKDKPGTVLLAALREHLAPGRRKRVRAA